MAEVLLLPSSLRFTDPNSSAAPSGTSAKPTRTQRVSCFPEAMPGALSTPLRAGSAPGGSGEGGQVPAPLRRAAAASRRREPGGDPNGSAPLGLQGEGPGRPPIRAAGFPSPLIRHKRFNYLFCHAQLQPQSILRLPLSAWQARGSARCLARQPGLWGVCVVCV